MILKKLLEKPILAIGILFMIIFLFSIHKKGIFKQHIENLTPSSCKSVLIMLDKRIPSKWTTSCKQNNLIIEIISSVKKSDYKHEKLFMAALYRDLANQLSFISHNSPVDGLERTPFCVVLYKNNFIDIAARVEGMHLAQFKNIKSPEMLKKHLQATVEVKEHIK